VTEAFDSLSTLEENIIQFGREMGHEKGSLVGRDQGRSMGYARGNEIGSEIGFYKGSLYSWKSFSQLNSSLFSSRFGFLAWFLPF
jgi:hypothetical protein